ncbi:MAG: protein kinase [Acidobacteria bacterium]|nr:protein kinase [Acidobacteriota bacterium]
MIGQRLSRYRIVEKLGEGGMGVVYRAHDERLDRFVAIKLLAPALSEDKNARLRLQREASLLSKLNHPNITTIHDFETVDDLAFLVMELVPGQTLADLVQDGPFSEIRIVEWAEQLCSGLAAAHSLGIIHRDLKPANLRMTPDGRLKILDFGLAKIFENRTSADDPTGVLLSQAGAITGTICYMAPEQLEGTILDGRTDIHAVGQVLYELATGHPPFQRKTVTEMIRAIAMEAPPTPASRGARISGTFEAIILRCLEKDPADRYQSALELLSDLQTVGARPEGRETSPDQVTVRRNIERPPRSVALLPFENATGAEEYAYLSTALPDAVATFLSRIRSLNVRPLSSTRRYLSTGTIPRNAGLELRVDLVVSGHFIADPVNIRVTLEVIDVDSDQLLWASALRVKRSEMEQIDTEVASRIRGELLPSLGLRAGTGADATRARNPEAYDLYLRSLALAENVAPNKEAIEMLEKGVAIDSSFAPAWSNLGLRHHLNGSYGHGGSEAYDLSQRAYLRAIALDPELLSATSGLIFHWVEKGDLFGAIDVARELLARRPDAVPAHNAMAYVLRFAGLHRESAEHSESALRLDRDPRTAHAALTYLALQEYDRALDFLELRSGTAWAENTRLHILLHKGAVDDALAVARSLAPDPAWPARLVAAFLEGRSRSEIARRAEEYVETNIRVARDPESSYLDGALMAHCGEVERAVAMIRSAIRGGYFCYRNLQRDPLIGSIRGLAEFSLLLEEARAGHDSFVSYLNRSSSKG